MTPPPRTPTPPRPLPKPPAPAAAPKPAAPPDHEALRALLEKWKKASHFDVLGVSEKTSAADVKVAYFALARQHHPDTVTEADPELRQLKAELTARMNEAYGVLSDDASRAVYVEELKGGGQVDVGPILQAEEDFLRATILVKARKFLEAIALLEGAIRLNPDEGEFHAWLAYAKFVSAKDKRLVYNDSVAECHTALKMNPHCAAAHLFVGHMSKIIGDMQKAEKAYKLCLQLDPNNTEAKSELRLIAARQKG
jgi:tetratricopeptide (TPR) repeat protein